MSNDPLDCTGGHNAQVTKVGLKVAPFSLEVALELSALLVASIQFF